MESKLQLKPDYLFEVSWEVCNKVGGIHTVLATKSPFLQKEFGDQTILIGPDVWKGAAENPEFTEDKTLFKIWRQHVEDQGLKIKIGRWNIDGNPIAVLVDFTPYFVNKNEIFADLWIKYKLDSLTGQWDYIEPALFGYVAGKVIECFYQCHINFTDKVIAQFHEWMTGAGVLYLKANVPQVATIFTTHATVLGRCIAGNGLPFYSHFDSYNPDQVAKDFNVISKHSLEKLTAQNADCFTTVSEITGKECQKFLDKNPDIITHNGFNPAIVPPDELFETKRAAARKKVFQVCEALFCQELDKDSLLVIKSGRYEFRNKGIDIFINSIADLNNKTSIEKTVIGLIFVPANQTGPRKELLDRLEKPDFTNPTQNEILTHNLQGAENDPIMNLIRKVGLDNKADKKAKIVYVPTYLDGSDGIFNLNYYDLLIGFDLAVFPSYYEPWGYTPLESIAFHIPAITTDISGFGLAINSMDKASQNGISVVHRTDDNEPEVINCITEIIIDFTKKTQDEINTLRLAAYHLSNEFSWQKLIVQYERAYNIALQKSAMRENLFQYRPQAELIVKTEKNTELKPVWRNIVVHSEMPASLAALQKLSGNLWIAWNSDAMHLFEYINKEAWENFQHNPILFLHSLSYKKISELENDPVFMNLLRAVEEKLDKYMSVNIIDNKPLIAYFCMEYGLDSYIKLYSGGLGILAGDYLKEASDQGINIIGIGLLYKNGYFKQNFSPQGQQLADPDIYEYANLPLQLVTDQAGNPLVLNLMLPGRTIIIHAWKLIVGRCTLYLLDTNVAGNSQEDQNITSGLYSGDHENRLKQELLLGLGGIRLLKALNIKPDIYHCNEGHSAFITLERLDNFIQDDHLSFEESFEVVRSSTVYTTHTSVAAGIDTFSEELLRKYISHKPHHFNIKWEILMGLGRIDANNHDEKFSMMYFAARMSGEINAVSKIHENVSRKLLNPLWDNFQPAELPVTSVTNGVHYKTWAARQLQELYRDILGDGFLSNELTQEDQDKIDKIPDTIFWEIRKELKKQLLVTLRQRLEKNLPAYSSPKKIFNAINIHGEDTLLIGFSRRFATYKRPDLLFKDLDRLSKIVNNAGMPVLFLFAGKAHPKDQPGIDLIRHVLNIAAMPEFENKILFIDNYDMDLAKHLVQGVDVWLNTPDRLMEASGTSGMKAAMNGVLNFSVLDGWWVEGYKKEAGWALPLESIYKGSDFQDQLDAETIYSTLEREIIPLYFERNEQGLPAEWIKRIKSSVFMVLSHFTTTRMIKEYNEKYYNKLFFRSNIITANGYAKAKELVIWKKKIAEYWKGLDVISVNTLNGENEKIPLGGNFSIEIVLDLGKLSVDDIEVEVVFMNKQQNNSMDNIFLIKELSMLGVNNNEASFRCDIPMSEAGTYSYSFRILPKHPLLNHKTDMGLIKWI